jgi:hypothetical protein
MKLPNGGLRLASAVYVNEHLLICGGINDKDEVLPSCFTLDTSKKETEMMADLAVPRWEMK